MKGLYELNCQKCNRPLGKLGGNAEITCPRCGGINKLTFSTKQITYESQLTKIKERTTSSGKQF